MINTNRTPAEAQYSPLYFLASVGAGGLTVTFFMYLLYWVPHPGQPVPVFEDILRYFTGATLVGKAMVVVALAGIIGFATLHYQSLIWNLRQLAKFKQTETYKALHNSNAETQMKAIPLTLAMSINVGFILGLVFVPGLWSVVEYLFPLALLAFLAVGVLAFRMLGSFFGRILTEGGFDPKTNTSFAQLLPAFALAMVAVGMAAPGAMSEIPWIVAVSLTFATFFIIASLLITLVGVIMAVMSMVRHGTAPEAAPTLMMLIPLMTVIGIALVRLDHGLHVSFDVHSGAGETLVLLTRLLSVQILFGLLGLMVLRRQNYSAKFLSAGGTRSAGSFALICPGVGLSVLLHFWVNKGLVATGLIAKFGVAYWIAIAPALILQFGTIYLMVKLYQLHFTKVKPSMSAIPAE